MGKETTKRRSPKREAGMVGAFIHYALTGLRGTLPFVLQTPRAIRRLQRPKRSHHPHQGEGEKTRRRRQMAAGRLVFHTYGETR